MGPEHAHRAASLPRETGTWARLAPLQWGGVPPCFFPWSQIPAVPFSQQLESLAWEHSGKNIVSSHSDGSYMVWAVGGSGQRTQQPVMATIPYGGWAPAPKAFPRGTRGPSLWDHIRV